MLLKAGRIGEQIKVDGEVMVMTTATAPRSAPYSMEKYDKALFIVSYGSAIGNLQSTISIVESANATGTTWSAISGATVKVGCATANQLAKAYSVILTAATDSTIGSVLDINGTTYTFATARAATAKEWGSTVDCTAAGGLEQCSSSLAAAINACQSSILMASTISTLALRVRVLDTADTYINVVSTSASSILAKYESAYAMVEVEAAKMSSTAKYIALSLGTVATAVYCGVMCIRSGGRYAPPYIKGDYTKTT